MVGLERPEAEVTKRRKTMMINFRSLKKRKKELVVEEGELFIMAAKRDDGDYFCDCGKGLLGREKRE